LTRNPYYSFVQDILTPGRLEHSLDVLQIMGELAEGYDLDREMAQTTGLLHDAG
jgi:HD superfamily phosphohydrolase YqeK